MTQCVRVRGVREGKRRKRTDPKMTIIDASSFSGAVSGPMYADFITMVNAQYSADRYCCTQSPLYSIAGLDRSSE